MTCIKRAKDSQAKCYWDNKERLQRKAHERYESLFKEEKEKRNNMVVNNIKTPQKVKKKAGWA